MTDTGRDREAVDRCRQGGSLVLTGCASRSDGSPGSAPRSVVAPAGVMTLLNEYGLAGKDAVWVLDHLDQLHLEQRPAADLKASVHPHEPVLSRGAQKVSLVVPGDRFYLSVASFVHGTHNCFHHSLTTCNGELAPQNVGVRILDETHVLPATRNQQLRCESR